MSEEPTKPCKRCREPIPEGATKCTKCQSWQTLGSAVWANPAAWLPLVMVPVFFACFYYILPHSDRGKDFSQYRDQIKIIDSHFRITSDTGHPKVVTVCILRNDSPVKWTHVTIEIHYLDQDGKLVGTNTEQDYHLVLLPGTEHAFEASTNVHEPATLYVSQKIFVRDARDARRWP